MYDHVTIRVSDKATSERFYETLFTPLGMTDARTGGGYLEWEDFSFQPATDERPVTTGLHIGFIARTAPQADAFWLAGTEAGYRSGGEPGPRPAYGPDYYGAFLLDPDGNSIEAAHHDHLRTSTGFIDHLWMRVADLDASRAFYDTIAPHGSFRQVADEPGRLTRYRALDGGGSLTIVQAGDDHPPTQSVHIAFPAVEDAIVDAFHAAATGAGHRDFGGPGERPEYHRGYYGAFVLDPDGNNIEVVHHGGRETPA